ncbi:u3 small nucleolar RNA-associated protein 11 [Hysterangium stoloniferum]|nr:u3 small nucleolar RNA-associated protein 11 [Hysterangium stoloniferum]
MSSLRNSLHRRNHKERSQLSNRTRFGILEKHGDYVKRARDFHSKQDRIKRLKEKAALRNKDEFYFGMIKSATERGVHIKDRGNASLPTDMVKILKTQDGNYIRAVRQAELKKIDKLKAQLSALADLLTPGKAGQDELDGNDDANLDEEELIILQNAGVLSSAKGKSKARRKSASNSKHVIFVSNDEEARKYHAPARHTMPESFKAAQQNDDDEDVDLGWAGSEKRTKKSSSHSHNLSDHAEDDAHMEERTQAAAVHRGRLLKELAARLKRDANLRNVARELEMQRLMMGKGAAKKIRGIESVEGDDDDKDEDDDEDALDARKGRRRKVDVGMEEKVYRPRVYKWKAERKK